MVSFFCIFVIVLCLILTILIVCHHSFYHICLIPWTFLTQFELSCISRGKNDTYNNVICNWRTRIRVFFFISYFHHKGNYTNICTDQQLKIDNDCCCCLVAKSCLTLYNSMDCSLPGSSPMWFSRQQYWNDLPSPCDLSNPRIKTCVPALQADSLPLSHIGSP